jgi:hypothetical protein
MRLFDFCIHSSRKKVTIQWVIQLTICVSVLLLTLQLLYHAIQLTVSLDALPSTTNGTDIDFTLLTMAIMPTRINQLRREVNRTVIASSKRTNESNMAKHDTSSSISTNHAMSMELTTAAISSSPIRTQLTGNIGTSQSVSESSLGKSNTHRVDNQNNHLVENDVAYYEHKILPFLELQWSDLSQGSLLPPWMVDYFKWHRAMRWKFPENAVFTHPNAPGVMGKVCDNRICGGLYDRLKYIAADLLLASMSNRVLLIKWKQPYDLEAFLEPNLLNWTAPSDFELYNFSRNKKLLYVKRKKPLSYVKQRIEDAKDIHCIRSFDGEINHILAAEMEFRNETDYIHNTTTFRDVWRALFKPSPMLRARLSHIMRQQRLTPRHYHSVHVRTRHPSRTGTIIANPDGSNADHVGLDFATHRQDVVLEALTAIKSVQAVSNHSRDPIYFYSDSDELVHYFLSHNAHTHNFTNMVTAERDQLDQKTYKVLATSQIVSRPLSGMTVHLDLQRGHPVETYLDTFLDLYIAALSQCAVYGVGNYGYLAAKLSGTNCSCVHQHIQGNPKIYNAASDRAPYCGDFRTKVERLRDS